MGKFEKYEIQYPLTFLFSVVKNKSIDYLRKELKSQETLAKLSEIGLREINTRIATLEACDPEKLYSNDIENIVNKALSTLPPKSKEVFLMSRSLNLTKEEIANTLGITKKGVEYHITKSLKCLRSALKDYLPSLLFFLF